MDITEVIKAFVEKARQDNDVSFAQYYKDLIESKVEVSFGGDWDEWDDIFHLGIGSDTRPAFFADVKVSEIQAIFDVLIANCPDDHECFQNFFENYDRHTTDDQRLIIYKKYFNTWYGYSERCAPGPILNVLDRSVKLCQQKDDEIKNLKDQLQQLTASSSQ